MRGKYMCIREKCMDLNIRGYYMEPYVCKKQKQKCMEKQMYGKTNVQKKKWYGKKCMEKNIWDRIFEATTCCQMC